MSEEEEIKEDKEKKQDSIEEANPSQESSPSPNISKDDSSNNNEPSKKSSNKPQLKRPPTYEEIQKEKSQKIHAKNLLEEANEIIETCIKCGMCKSLCPVFKVLREERISPRGHSILLQEKIISETFFECNLCRACEQKCPLDLKICDAILKAREAMVLRNKGLKSNEEMIENILKTGSPFGENPNEDGKLYCC